MKKTWILGMALCGLLSVSNSAYGQSLKDILKSSAVKDAVTAVTGGKTLSIENLAGTWTYTSPAVQLEGDNALKNVTGSVATAELEKKMKEQCAKVGIVEGTFKYTFNTDNTFTCVLKGRTLSGTYTLDTSAKTVTMNFGKTSKLQLAKMTASVTLADDQLSLLYDADKLLNFLTKLSSLTSNSTVQTLSSLANQYDGMKLGFELKK